MHETIIANDIIKKCRAQGDVESCYVEIGELAHVPPPELVECLKTLADWKIEYKEIPAEVECGCGFRGHPTVLERGHDHFMIECPKCRSIPKLISGTEVKLVNVVVR